MQTDTKSTQSIGFYRLPKVLEIFPISRSGWYAGIKAGRHPAGVKIGPRTTAWHKTDIEELCNRLSGDAK